VQKVKRHIKYTGTVSGFLQTTGRGDVLLLYLYRPLSRFNQRPILWKYLHQNYMTSRNTTAEKRRENYVDED